MKALTIHQPYAWAIAAGWKDIENRWRTTSHRGPLAIHAGLTVDREVHLPVQKATDAYAQLGGDDGLWEITRPRPAGTHPLMACGAIIAVADLVDVCTARSTDCGCGPWAVRGYQTHWRLDNVRPLAEPVHACGFQMIWQVPDEVEDAVCAQLPEVTGA